MRDRLKQLWADLKSRLAGEVQPVITPAIVFERFRKILTSNNLALEIIADLGEKLGGDYIFDRHYIETGFERIRSAVKTSIDGLCDLCNENFADLYTIYERLTAELERMLAGLEDRRGPQVLPLDTIHFLDWEIVGGKGARLSEMRQDPFLHVPAGFVITTKSYHDLIDHNDLRAELDIFEQSLVDAAINPGILGELGLALQRKILQSTPPPNLLDDLNQNIEQMIGTEPDSLFLAVRSSAQEEDMDFSFAGQFQSIINVKGDPLEVFRAYLKVVASLFSPEVVNYRRQFLPNDKRMSIAAVCQRMVKARASGVAFSVDTMAPANETMVIVGAWGQGAAIVEGQLPTDTFILSKDNPPAIVERNVEQKAQGYYMAESGGLEKRKIDYALWREPCLTDTQLMKICRQVRHLELVYKKPQDVEWSVDENDNLYLLQSRPLIISEEAFKGRALPQALADYEVIVAGRGRVAQHGIGAGPVHIVNGPADLVNFPEGAVLVSRLDSSHFLKVMKQAAAIVTEVGTPVSHMATLCREMRVPCLVNVNGILSKVVQGDEITVDAEDNVIYRGKVRELLVYNTTTTMQLGSSHEFRLLRRLLKKISTLNLIDPLLDEFAVDKCRTYHDILRYVHEKAVMELVSLGHDEGKLLQRNVARRMDLPIPAGIMVIDIGGGLADNAPDTGVKFTDVSSIPFHAILQGMLFPGVWNMAGVRVGMRDLMSSMLAAPQDTLDGRYSGHNIAIISKEYVNLCFRLGYHFNIIDAHCSRSERDNHIYFRFLGGATDITKRTRRATMIAKILEAFDFNVRLKGDMVVARSGNMVMKEMERTLDILGRLVGFTRQLDVRLEDDNIVEQYVEAFLYGNYGVVTDPGAIF